LVVLLYHELEDGFDIRANIRQFCL